MVRVWTWLERQKKPYWQMSHVTLDTWAGFWGCTLYKEHLVIGTFSTISISHSSMSPIVVGDTMGPIEGRP